MSALRTANAASLAGIVLHATLFGKLIFGILLICSVLSIAVIIERFLAIRRMSNALERDIEQIAQSGSSATLSSLQDSIAAAERDTDPLFAVLRTAIARRQDLQEAGEERVDVLQAMVTSALGRELKLVRAFLRSRLPILANIASTAPFIGLLGTVVGIIATFEAISRSGSMGQELAASGIAESLTATALGLFAAIPAVVAYNVYVEQINRLMLRFEAAAMEHAYFIAASSDASSVSSRA